MGYDTNFTLLLYNKQEGHAEQAKTKFSEVFNDIEKQSGYTLSDRDEESGIVYLNESHWYDCEEDLQKVSKKHPDIIIVAQGEGEERDDNWETRFLDGKMESVRAQIVWPPFKEILIGNENKD